MAVNDTDILKVVVSLLLADNTIAQMVYHFLADFAAQQTNADVLDAVEVKVEDIYTELADEVSDAVTLDSMEVDVVEWDETEQEFLTTQTIGERSPSVTFTEVTEALPNQMAATMGAYTTYPKVRGRKAFPGFAENAADVGTLTTAAATALSGALAEYLGDITISAGNTLSPGVASKSTEAFRAFGSGWINTILGSQRSRKPGVGA